MALVNNFFLLHLNVFAFSMFPDDSLCFCIALTKTRLAAAFVSI